MRKYFTLALLVFAGNVHAQMVYKCVGKDGVSELTSFPCDKNKRTVKAVYAPPEPYRPPVQRPAPAVRQQQQTYYSYSGPSAGDVQRQQRLAQCNAVRSEYNRVQADFKLNRNIELLRRLEARIRQFCD